MTFISKNSIYNLINFKYKNCQLSNNKVGDFFMKEKILGFVTGLFNGFFGAGGGTILVPGMERFLNIKPHNAHASAIAVIFPLSIISAIIYFFKVELMWQNILYVSIGGVIGGYLGANLLNKFSSKYLHIIFGFFMLLGAFKSIL